MGRPSNENQAEEGPLKSCLAPELKDWFSQGDRFVCSFSCDPINRQVRTASVACHSIDDLARVPSPTVVQPEQKQSRSTTQCITFLHGYPGCSYDFYPLIQCLIKSGTLSGYRLLLIDLLGYGDSDKGVGQDSFTTQQQANVVQAVWRRYRIQKSDLVMHGLGVSVGLELLCKQHRGPLFVQLGKLFWLNGPVFSDFYKMLPYQQRLAGRTGWLVARLMSPQGFNECLSSMFSKEHPASAQWLQGAYQSLCHRGGNKVHHKLLRLNKDMQRHKHFWQGALELSIRRDAQRHMFCWGTQDPVGGNHMLAYIQKRFGQYNVRISDHADLGHWPHVEDPARVAQLLTDFLQEPYTPSYTQRMADDDVGERATRSSSCPRVSVDHGRLTYGSGSGRPRRRSSLTLLPDGVSLGLGLGSNSGAATSMGLNSGAATSMGLSQEGNVVVQPS